MEIATVSPKVDHWALGAVWYEMVTGEKAFPQEDRVDIFAAITNGKITLQPTSDANFLKIINGLLQVDAEKRQDPWALAI